MAKRLAGSTRKLSLDGIEYGVAADSDVPSQLSSYNKEVTPTSGLPMVQMIKQIPFKGPFEILADGAEKEQLKSQAASLENLTCIYVDAAGNEYSCEGTIMLGEGNSKENKVPVTVYPADDRDWTYMEA